MTSHDNIWGRNVREERIPLDDYGTNAFLLRSSSLREGLSPSSLAPPPFTTAPKVLLCGWYGATPRTLRRHVRMFHGWGYVVVVILTPTSVVFAPRVTGPVKFCVNILTALLRAENIKDSGDGRFFDGGLVLMCMSTAGSMVAYGFAQLFRMVDEGNNARHTVRLDDSLKNLIMRTRMSLAAVVFDSAPAKMHDAMGGQAFAIGQGADPNSVTGRALRAFHSMYCATRRWILDDLPSHFWDWLCMADYGGGPELYIFSRDDALLDVEALEALIKKRKETGRPIRTLQAEHAPHVATLKVSTNAYIDTLGSFLDDAMATCRARLGHHVWKHSSSITAKVLIASAKL